jgi:hypothetical protein
MSFLTCADYQNEPTRRLDETSKTAHNEAAKRDADLNDPGECSRLIRCEPAVSV